MQVCWDKCASPVWLSEILKVSGGSLETLGKEFWFVHGLKLTPIKLELSDPSWPPKKQVLLVG